MNRDVQESFVANTGYVLQLATPYYEELTVRDNITLASELKLNGLTREEKFERVRDVMEKVRTLSSLSSLIPRPSLTAFISIARGTLASYPGLPSQLLSV